MSLQSRSLAVSLGRLELRNPVLAASGTYGSGIEVMDFVDLSKIGGVVTKSVTTRRRRGNLPPRIHETASGIINSIGLMNPGLEGFMEHVLPRLRLLPCARVVNVAGESADDFALLTSAFDAEPAVDAIELNVSCPNVSGGLDFGVDAALLEAVVGRCRGVTEKALIVKLTPNVTDIGAMACAAARAGADVLSLVNTYQGLAVDWKRRRPELGSSSGMGGLSGPAIKPLALAALHRVRRSVDLPLIGIGGIMNASDVMEFIVTGASAVQIGTACFGDPATPVTIARDLEAMAEGGQIEDLPHMIGSLRIPRVPG